MQNSRLGPQRIGVDVDDNHISGCWGSCISSFSIYFSNASTIGDVSPSSREVSQAYEAPVVTPPVTEGIEEDSRETENRQLERDMLLPKASIAGRADNGRSDAGAGTSDVTISMCDNQRGQHVPNSNELSVTDQSVRYDKNCRVNQEIIKPGHHRGGSFCSQDISTVDSRANHRRTGSRGTRTKGASAGSASELSIPSGKLAMPQDEEDFCPTCLEAYSKENPKIWTECGHHFHMPCIFEWMERKDTCPLCESKMNF